MLISGPGSRWLIEGRPDFGGNDTSVVVEQEGLLETWEGSVQTGGTITITGAGSEWAVRDDIQVAGGRLVIENGATLRSSLGSVGRDRYSTKPEWAGAVSVSGAGSQWINQGTVTVGTPLGTGAEVDSLALSDGGLLATARLEIQPTGLVTGDGGTIAGDVTNSGTIAPGSSPGVLTIDGNFTQYSDGRLAFEIAGPQNYDQLVVTGHATLAGSLSLDLLDGYVPELGTTFSLFDFGTVEGSLMIEFPRLGDGLGWDTRQLLSDGVISVAPMSAIPEPPTVIAILALLLAFSLHCRFAIFNLHFAITWGR